MISSDNKHYKSVLRFWRAIEIFHLPDLPKPKRDDRRIFTELYPDKTLPWNEPDFQSRKHGKRWQHTLYFCPVEKQHVITLIDKYVKGAGIDFQEPLPGKTCLSSLVLGEYGNLPERSYVRASFIYGLKIVKNNEPLEKVNDYLKNVQKDYLLRFHVNPANENKSYEYEKDEVNESQEEDSDEYGEDEVDEYEEDDTMEEEIPMVTPVDWKELENEYDDLKKTIPDLINEPLRILCVSELVSEDKEPEAVFLNSFYISDLNMLIKQVAENDIGSPLKRYLSRNIDLKKRFDFQNKSYILQGFNPALQSPGRWPSNPEYGLYSAQQAAVNLTLADLTNNTDLIGINGPPGTGKTTLLREIVSDIVVTRAKRILEYSNEKLFPKKAKKIADYTWYYEINEAISGNDGIIVASNNNKAVENISLELPLVKNIDIKSFSNAAYFPHYANKILPGKSSWGLLSAALGNSENRYLFSTRFGSSDGFVSYLKELAENEEANKLTREFDLVAADLHQLLKEYEEFREIATSYHEAVMKKLFPKTVKKSVRPGTYRRFATILSEKYQIKSPDLIDEGFENLTIDQIHRLTPYSSEYVNKLRSDIFLKSLELHACTIKVNARYFRSNLNTFLDMLAGRHAEFIDQTIARNLWNSFFFCVPVMSTTLASVERLFAKPGKQSIGWLLLDEAGQATPQSACGAIWRAKRSILIGDTLQIPPVVTIPKALAKLLQVKSGVKDDSWSPVYHSAQFLADRATNYGTYINVNDNNIWTGLPLRAHRRCNEPMFSIANEIAYNGQMVKVTEDEKADLVNSCWIDIAGKSINGHIINEEINILRDRINKIRRSGYRDIIYVISPFRVVGNYCAEIFKDGDKVSCGTIHTFQGREADVVFIVLGGDPSNTGARKWASEAPNLLNVAITRAKKRLYVIGNSKLWGSCNYFKHLAKNLPLIQY